MDKLLLSLNKLLNALPFNGDKTTLGLVLKIMLPILVAKFPFILLYADTLDSLAEVLVALGLTHKTLKQFVKKK